VIQPDVISPAPRRKPAPKQARSAAKRRAILDAAERLLETLPPADITTRRIAEQADVPIGSVYRYFTDVNDLLPSLFERMNAGTIDVLQGHGIDGAQDWRVNLNRIFDHLQTMHAEHPAYGALMAHIDLRDRDAHKIMQLLSALLQRTLPHVEAPLIGEITETVIALLEGIERRLYRLPKTRRRAALGQARIAVAAYLAHYIEAAA
jgi:AcrR family transcriptional regulator